MLSQCSKNSDGVCQTDQSKIGRRQQPSQDKLSNDLDQFCRDALRNTPEKTASCLPGQRSPIRKAVSLECVCSHEGVSPIRKRSPILTRRGARVDAMSSAAVRIARLMNVQLRSALVTGGAGFIGHHLANALLGRGYRVRVLDNFSSGKRSRLPSGNDALEIVQGSILDDASLARAMAGIDVVFHEAALVSVPASLQQPLEYHEVNATGTLRVLETARAAGVKRLIYAASSAAYGDLPDLPKRETQRPLPISPYAVSKYIGELYASVYCHAYGLQTISLRYFNVFGPEQDPKSQYGAAIPSIVTAILRGQAPTIYGDGEQTRDFCYIDNVVQANLLAAESPRLSGEVVNIACGRRVSVNAIVAQANRLLGTNIRAQYVAPRPGDVRDSVADISLATELLGYRPQVQFEEGLEKAIAYYKQSAK